jgi:electron transfer flavoprotein alpha subunit
MRVLVVMEEAPPPDAFALVARAFELGAEVRILIFHADTSTDASALTNQVGPAAELLVAAHPIFAQPGAPERIQVILELHKTLPFDAILFPPSVIAPEVAGALSASLDVDVHWGLTDLETRNGNLIGLRPVRDDALVAEVEWTQRPAIAVFRSVDVQPANVGGQVGVRALDVEELDHPAWLVERNAATPVNDLNLQAAAVVVGAGRGLKDATALQMIAALASAVDGSWGVSLPLVDMGWAPRARQIGQTGTVISPKLYIACGVSGQFQHRLGIEKSKYIVSINSDRTAPIVQMSSLAIIGDLHALLPPLIEAVNQARGKGR